MRSLLAAGLALAWSLILVECASLWLLPPLPTAGRIVAAGIAILPGALVAEGLYFYGSRAWDSPVGPRFYLMSLVSGALVMAPGALLVTRYMLPWPHAFEIIRLGVTGWALTFMVLLFMGRTPSGDSRLSIVLLGHIKSVMWDAWRNDGAASVAGTDERDLRRRRGAFYSRKTGVLEFQRSLTCSIFDADCALSLLGQRRGAAPLRVLDIGGGDGRFSARLLQGLRKDGSDIAEVVLVDPIDWEREYKATLSSVVAPERITFENQGFEAFADDRQYDLVVASHSLYAVLDGATGVEGVAPEEWIRKLLARRAANGVALVIMASSRGTSYAFKNRALEAVTGAIPPDASAEGLRPHLQAAGKWREAYVDSVINLADILGAYRDGRVEPAAEWLSYFLRVSVPGKQTEQLSHLVEMLDGACVEMDEMHEDTIGRYTTQGVPRTSRVLTHKTVVWCSDS